MKEIYTEDYNFFMAVRNAYLGLRTSSRNKTLIGKDSEIAEEGLLESTVEALRLDLPQLFLNCIIREGEAWKKRILDHPTEGPLYTKLSDIGITQKTISFNLIEFLIRSTFHEPDTVFKKKEKDLTLQERILLWPMTSRKNMFSCGQSSQKPYLTDINFFPEYSVESFEEGVQNLDKEGILILESSYSIMITNLKNALEDIKDSTNEVQKLRDLITKVQSLVNMALEKKLLGMTQLLSEIFVILTKDIKWKFIAEGYIDKITRFENDLLNSSNKKEKNKYNKGNILDAHNTIIDLSLDLERTLNSYSLFNNFTLSKGFTEKESFDIFRKAYIYMSDGYGAHLNEFKGIILSVVEVGEIEEDEL